jgi:hypothetical protein
MALVSSGSSGSMRKKARLLWIHHRNISTVVSRHKKMDSAKRFEWTLSIWKIRVDVLNTSTKNIAISWWVSETRMSPNRKEVVTRCVGPGMRDISDEKPKQYLLESHV